MQTVDMFELLGTKRLEPESIEIVERSLENIYLRATRATFHGVSPDLSPPHLLRLKAVGCTGKQLQTTDFDELFKIHLVALAH